METLDQDLLKQIVHIISNRKKVRKIILFSSRARGIFKKTSDIDLAIMDPDWTDSDINLTKHALIDLLEDRDKISHIDNEKQAKIIYEKIKKKHMALLSELASSLRSQSRG